MNLELAILNVLAASPRALTALTIVAFVSDYTGKDETLTDVAASLRRLEAKGEVKGTSNPDRGGLWKETDDGRLRIA